MSSRYPCTWYTRAVTHTTNYPQVLSDFYPLRGPYETCSGTLRAHRDFPRQGGSYCLKPVDHMGTFIPVIRFKLNQVFLSYYTTNYVFFLSFTIVYPSLSIGLNLHLLYFSVFLHLLHPRLVKKKPTRSLLQSSELKYSVRHTFYTLKFTTGIFLSYCRISKVELHSFLED